MGLLTAFSVGMATFVTERVFSAKDGFLHELFSKGTPQVIAGAVTAVLASLFFYRQRSHLAWHYGQIALAEARGDKSPKSVEELLSDADSWKTWWQYQTGFIVLTLSFSYYSLAMAEALNLSLTISHLCVIIILLFIAIIAVCVNSCVLMSYPQEDSPWGKLLSRK